MSVAGTCQPFQSLHLDLLLEDWVDRVWSSDLTDSDSAWPDDFQTTLENEDWLVSPLTKAVGDLRLWITEETDVVHQRFWANLNDCEVDIRGLISMVYCFIANCDKKTICGPQRESALLAAHLYVTMLRIPGSNAFKVFHSVVFEKCLELLNYSQWRFQVSHSNKRKRGRQDCVPTQHKMQRLHQCPSQSQPSQDSSELDSEQLEVQTSASGMKRVQMLQTHLLKDIVLMLSEMSLRDHTHSVDKLIQILASLTQSECNVQPDSAVPGSMATMQSPCQLAFAGLEGLCQTRHGTTSQSLLTIFRFLLPNLLMRHGRHVASSATIPQSLLETKNRTADFVCHVIQVHADDKEVQKVIRTLVQQMCIRVTDRAEYRLKVAQTVCHIMKQVPVNCFCGLLSWICTLAKTSQVSDRMMAVNVIVCLATTENCTRSDAISCNSLSASEKEVLDPEYLIIALLARCSDCSSNVRSKALLCIFSCATHNMLKYKLCNLLYPQDLNPDEEDALASHRAGVVLPMLVRRTNDEKLQVRRVALQALEAVLLLDILSVTEEMLAIFYHRSMDPGLSVRKQALSSITALLMALPDHRKLQSLWLDSVLPVIVDCETSAQEKCLELMDNMIMKKLVGAEKSSDVEHRLAWNLLNAVASDDCRQLRRYLQRACMAWGRQKRLGHDFVKSVINHADDDLRMAGVWLILSSIAPYCLTIAADFVVNSYYQFASQSDKSTIQSQIVSVMGQLASQLGKHRMETLGTELSSVLAEMEATPELVCSILTCLTKFSENLSDPKKGSPSRLSSWVTPVMNKCIGYMRQVVMGEVQLEDDSNEQFARYLYAIGETAQRCSELLTDDVSVMIQSLIVGRPLNGSSAGVVLSGKCRAHVFIALGKLCLQNRDLAKESIVLLARELEESEDPVVRNNVIVVMTDLCVRYTSIVDRYVSNMALCLQDSEPFVRRQTLILLTNLLQEDYVKWRGSLFFHFLTSLVDQNKDIRQFAKFCLVHLLHSRHPEMFFHHFVECVFHFNDYDAHPAYNKFKQSDKEKKMFSLRGDQRKSDRMEIYAFLLENVTDEQRFQITARLCQDVLGGVIDDVIPLNDRSCEVIADTLTVLCSSEIKLTHLQAKPTGDEDQDVVEDNPAAAALVKARTKIVSQLVKKNVMENIVPIIIALKQILEKAHSSLLRELMTYLQELLKDYKDELHDIMSSDRQLASEIEFDLRRFEAQRKEATRATGLSTIAGSPQAQMVVSPLPETPRTLRNLLTTPHSTVVPQLRKAVLQNSCHRRMQSSGKSNGSPALGPSKKAAQTPVVSKSKDVEVQQLHYQEAGELRKTVGGLMVEGHTEGVSQDRKSCHIDELNRATSTPHGDLTSISFRGTRRSTSIAMPPSPIECKQSILFMDYPKDGRQLLRMEDMESDELQDSILS